MLKCLLSQGVAQRGAAGRPARRAGRRAAHRSPGVRRGTAPSAGPPTQSIKNSRQVFTMIRDALALSRRARRRADQRLPLSSPCSRGPTKRPPAASPHSSLAGRAHDATPAENRACARSRLGHPATWRDTDLSGWRSRSRRICRSRGVSIWKARLIGRGRACSSGCGTARPSGRISFARASAKCTQFLSNTW